MGRNYGYNRALIQKGLHNSLSGVNSRNELYFNSNSTVEQCQTITDLFIYLVNIIKYVAVSNSEGREYNISII